ncbi:CWC16 protein [Fusarium venenatum]|nr:CWC16 protein [Fusarium venenatum]
MQGFNMGRYVPPDVEGTISANALHKKHPLGARASKPGSLTVRFELPYAVWCSTCPKPTIIGQGVRFNAEKRRVGSYFSTPIWSFKLKHVECGGEIEIRTDPKNTAYVVVAGGAKRDTGEDVPREGDNVIMTDQEREALRKNAFASLEKTIEDREQLKNATLRIDELLEASAKHWDDPYTQNQKLRKAFRVGRKEREHDAAATEDLQDRMSLGIDIVPGTEDDARRAALVDFGSVEDGRDRALSKPLFKTEENKKKFGDSKSGSKLKADKEVSKRKETFVSELMGNTRAAKDPFLNDGRIETKGPARLPGVKRKRPAQEAESHTSKPPAKAQVRAAEKMPTGLVDYDSD